MQPQSISLRWIFILVGTAIYSFLFFNQSAGINFLLFTTSVVALLIISNKSMLKDKHALFLSSLALLSAVSVYLHNSYLAIWANFICLFLLPAFAVRGENSVILNLFTSIFSTLGSVVFMVLRMIQNKTKTSSGRGWKILAIGAPIVLIIVFFFIYKSMNPLFGKLTESINFDFVSWNWIFFTLGGFFLLWGYFLHSRIKPIDKWESEFPLIITDTPETKPSKWNEKRSIAILFIAVNLMLLLINLMDINYLYLGAGMPEGVTHKGFVHNGVSMLILSILLGVSIILFFFRGKLNFDSSNKFSQILAIVWIGQNLFMILSTWIRNQMYVNEALLTYKRIGVFAWLVFAVIGLSLTIIKLYKAKSTWFIIRYKLVLIVTVFVVSATLDWDQVISNFNINKMSQTKVKDISGYDKNYLLSLSEGNISALYGLVNKPGFEVDSVYSYGPDGYQSNKNWLDWKTYNFLDYLNEGDWRSTSARKNRVLNEINTLYENGGFRTINLQGKYQYVFRKSNAANQNKSGLAPIMRFKKLEELTISYNSLSKADIGGLNTFLLLRKLNASSCDLNSLDTVIAHPNLTFLNLENNNLLALGFLEKFPNLDSLLVSHNKINSLWKVPVLSNLRHLDLSSNQLMTVEGLEKFPALESLNLRDQVELEGEFPLMGNLRTLNISDNKTGKTRLQEILEKTPRIQSLDVSKNELYHFPSFENISNPYGNLNAYHALKTIIARTNHIEKLDDLITYKNLEVLDVENNLLSNLSSIVELTNLRDLNVSDNRLERVVISDTCGIQHLNISGNKTIKEINLYKLNQLKSLNISHTNLDSLSYIPNPEILEALYIQHCFLKDFETISSFTNLRTLWISHVDLNTLELIKLLPKLESLHIINSEVRYRSKFIELENKGVKVNWIY